MKQNVKAKMIFNMKQNQYKKETKVFYIDINLKLKRILSYTEDMHSFCEKQQTQINFEESKNN